MIGPQPALEFGELLLRFQLDDVAIRDRLRRIENAVLSRSRYIRTHNFTTIHTEDLEFLFGAYDEAFFNARMRQALGQTPIRFRLSTRMTRAGGKTTRYRTPVGLQYEIAIACGLLFQGFREHDRGVRVTGLDCENRLQALLRIFEHELVHLIESLCWNHTNCAAPRFQDIAARHFLHRAHTHELVTWQERAVEHGIRPGSWVHFDFEGRHLKGRVNRITRRATVLVEDLDGAPYSDGKRYRKYYVPIAGLEPIAATE